MQLPNRIEGIILLSRRQHLEDTPHSVSLRWANRFLLDRCVSVFEALRSCFDSSHISYREMLFCEAISWRAHETTYFNPILSHILRRIADNIAWFLRLDLCIWRRRVGRFQLLIQRRIKYDSTLNFWIFPCDYLLLQPIHDGCDYLPLQTQNTFFCSCLVWLSWIDSDFKHHDSLEGVQQ